MTALRNPKRAKTRCLVLAEDSPQLNRTAKLAQVFTEIHVALLSLEQDGAQLVAELMNLPSRRKFPDYYELIDDPIDLQTIEKNINSGSYKDLVSYEGDVIRLFDNVDVSN